MGSKLLSPFACQHAYAVKPCKERRRSCQRESKHNKPLFRYSMEHIEVRMPHAS